MKTTTWGLELCILILDKYTKEILTAWGLVLMVWSAIYSTVWLPWISNLAPSWGKTQWFVTSSSSAYSLILRLLYLGESLGMCTSLEMRSNLLSEILACRFGTLGCGRFQQEELASCLVQSDMNKQSWSLGQGALYTSIKSSVILCKHKCITLILTCLPFGTMGGTRFGSVLTHSWVHTVFHLWLQTGTHTCTSYIG